MPGIILIFLSIACILADMMHSILSSMDLSCVHQTLAATQMDDKELTGSMQKLLLVMQKLDDKIGPMLEADGEHFNKR